jgi:hypothetical protein
MAAASTDLKFREEMAAIEQCKISYSNNFDFDSHSPFPRVQSPFGSRAHGIALYFTSKFYAIPN